MGYCKNSKRTDKQCPAANDAAKCAKQKECPSDERRLEFHEPT